MNATTSFTPTNLGASFGAAPDSAPAPATIPGLQFPQSFPLNLPADQLNNIQLRVNEFNFSAARLQDLALLSQEPTNALNRTLDGFLDRVNKAENPQLFQLVDALSEEIAKERIGELAEQILDAKPSLWHRFLGLFSKKALQRGLDIAYEELGRIARNKSKTLSDLVQDRERTLQGEMQRLSAEVQAMEAIKNQYRQAFTAFAVEVLFLHNVLLKAQAEAPALLAAAQHDTLAQQDIQDKLQALESNALSREAMMTRLPAEQLVIRQIQNAGISTMQELAVTMGDRFASIRMTLLAIHGANLVRNVQRLGQANANLDNQLQEARAKLMNTVVSTAATAPGNNRVEQANNLKRVVADTRALHELVEQAREANKAKFAEARQTMAQVRQELLDLGQKINPGAPLAR